MNDTLEIIVSKEDFFKYQVKQITKIKQEIRDTNCRKYLQSGPNGLFFNDNIIDKKYLVNSFVYTYNEGNYPFYPIEYKKIVLICDKDRAEYKVIRQKLEICLDADLKPMIFDMGKGKNALWQMVYELY